MDRNALAREKEIRKQVIDLDFNLIEEGFAGSKGANTMTLEELKLVVVGLHGLCLTQQHLIDYLYRFLLTPPKNPWYKRIFRK